MSTAAAAGAVAAGTSEHFVYRFFDHARSQHLAITTTVQDAFIAELQACTVQRLFKKLDDRMKWLKSAIAATGLPSRQADDLVDEFKSFMGDTQTSLTSSAASSPVIKSPSTAATTAWTDSTASTVWNPTAAAAPDSPRKMIRFQTPGSGSSDGQVSSSNGSGVKVKNSFWVKHGIDANRKLRTDAQKKLEIAGDIHFDWYLPKGMKKPTTEKPGNAGTVNNKAYERNSQQKWFFGGVGGAPFLGLKSALNHTTNKVSVTPQPEPKQNICSLTDALHLLFRK
jgi:hypothetical protein